MGRASYAVTWRENDGPRYAGKLQLSPGHLRLEGRTSAREVLRTIGYAEVVAVDVARADEHRLLELTLVRRKSLRIECLGGPGSLTELAGKLRTRTAAPTREEQP